MIPMARSKLCWPGRLQHKNVRKVLAATHKRAVAANSDELGDVAAVIRKRYPGLTTCTINGRRKLIYQW